MSVTQIANINNCYMFVELMLQLSDKYGQDANLPKIDNHRLKSVGELFHNLASEMYVLVLRRRILLLYIRRLVAACSTFSQLSYSIHVLWLYSFIQLVQLI